MAGGIFRGQPVLARIPTMRINVGSDTAFQVYNATLPNATRGQLFPSGLALGDAGFYVHEGQRLISTAITFSPSGSR